ncbi:MAG: hypothetical protein HYS13_19330 [Planctomycetia bacterium]|nr:hypothetical protein [Planctomycetia bacterium]
MKALQRFGVWLAAMVLAAGMSLAQDAKKADANPAQENKAAADDKQPAQADEKKANDKKPEAPKADDPAKPKEEPKPAPLPDVKKGDVVIVVPETADLQRGADIVAKATKDQELEVLKVSGNWVGTAVTVEGKKVGGWIHKKYIKVKPVEDGPIEAPEPPAEK